MVAPVTSFVKNVDEDDYYLVRNGKRQRQPYDLVLAYQVKAARVLARRLYGPGDNEPGPIRAINAFIEPTPSWDDAARIEQAKSRAYEKLLGSISDRANWGENIGQLKESYELIYSSLMKLKTSIKSLRQRDPTAFGKWMLEGSKSHKQHWFRPANKIATGVLILDFAILPTVSDIFSAINVLQSPVKNTKVRGRSHVSKDLVYDPGTPGTGWWTESGNVFAEYGALVGVSNPNLWLANTMGLINPAQIAWQLTPGSFLFDWLANVEQILGTFTDFLGLEVQSAYTSVTVKSTKTLGFSPGFYRGQVVLLSAVNMTRTPGISLPSLRFRPLKIPGAKRAANAAALAVLAFGPRPSSAERLSSLVLR